MKPLQVCCLCFFIRGPGERTTDGVNDDNAGDDDDDDDDDDDSAFFSRSSRRVGR